MKRRRMSVDPRCADLADLFLSDVKGATDEDKTELAEAIQRACEDFISVIEQGSMPEPEGD